MSGHDQKTEKPTPRRLEKARKDGDFPASKEFVAAAGFLGIVWMAGKFAESGVPAAVEMFRRMLRSSFEVAVSSSQLHREALGVLLQWLATPLLYGGGLTAFLIALHLAVTRLGLSWGKLRPDFSRLNPKARLSEMPSRNLTSAAQAMVVLAVFGWVLHRLAQSYAPQAPALARMPVGAAAIAAARMIDDLLWKAALVFSALGLVDLFRQQQRWSSRLKMSRQEIRDEHKESEGNPLIKSKIRRLQKDMLQRRMMQQVPTASAVIVNPTHYAVAIRYQPGMAAPKVVAKGKNWLALRIRDIALRNQVPVIENAPLARGLYSAADVGSEIPPDFYQAVAEVLAYVYRLMRNSGLRAR